MNYFPLAVRIKDKEVLVAGGGSVAERKIIELRKAGARITVVAPVLTKRLAALARVRSIRWFPRRVQPSDIQGKELVIAATSERKVNEMVSRYALSRSVWVNVVDQPRLSNFISVATARQSRVIVSVYSDGRDPVLSRDVKNFLKENWDAFVLYRYRLQKRAA